MSPTKRYLLFLGTFVAVFTVVSIGVLPRVLADTMKPLLTEIVNTVGVNVLNQPTVHLSGIPQVAVVNSHPVTVEGIPTVKVVNDTLAVQTPASGSGEVFQIVLAPYAPVGLFGGSDQFPVPSNRRLIIEYVGVRAFTLLNADEAAALVHVTVAGVDGLYPVPLGGPILLNNAYQHVGAQQMKVYADPGTVVACELNHSDSSHSANAACTISGYFIKVP